MTKMHLKTGLILMLIIILGLAGCTVDTGLGDGDQGKIMGTVTLDGSPVSGVTVSIKNSDIDHVTTDSNGAYEFADLENDTYTLVFSNTDPAINEEVTVVISGGKTVTKNLQLTSNGGGSGDTSLEDVKTFVNEVKENGINLKQVGMEQTLKIRQNMETKVIPQMAAVSYRLNLISEDIMTWYMVMNMMNFQPGAYTYDEEVYPPITDANPTQGYIDDPTWTWDISYAGTSDSFTITVTNVNDIFTMTQDPDTNETNITVDFTDAQFNYAHNNSAQDVTLDWSYDYTLTTDAGAEEQIIKSFVDDSGDVPVTYNITATLPRVASATGTGTITDNLFVGEEWTLNDNDTIDESDDYVIVLPEIGEVSLNTSMNLDFENQLKEEYSGSFISKDVNDNKVFSFIGSTSVTFDSVPTYQEMVDLEAFPVISSYSSEGSFSTDVFEIKGSTSVDFLSKEIIKEDDSTVSIPLPDTIEFTGEYEDISVNEGTYYNGTLTLDPDYSEFTIDLGAIKEIETENNYLGFSVTLNGQLINLSYLNNNQETVDVGDTTLDLSVARTGYRQLQADFDYSFADGAKSIQGNASYDDINEEFQLTASNQQNIKLVIEPSAYTEPQIGEITNDDGSEQYATIDLMQDGTPIINYSDNTTSSILP